VNRGLTRTGRKRLSWSTATNGSILFGKSVLIERVGELASRFGAGPALAMPSLFKERLQGTGMKEIVERIVRHIDQNKLGCRK